MGKKKPPSASRLYEGCALVQWLNPAEGKRDTNALTYYELST